MDSETYAISLVDEPAIEQDFVALSKDKDDYKQVFLESNERHMCYGPALIPDKDIYRNDGENEYYLSFTKESIVKMSQEYLKEYRQYEVKTDHEEIANEVCVVESWIVEDEYKDKSNALGINVPEGTWMIGIKVNNIDTWERIKAGELRGFSVESFVSLEEFGKQNDNNMEINANEMGFWNKMKEVLAEAFSKKEEAQETEPNVIESTNVDLEEQTPPAAEPAPVVETPQEAPKVEEPAPVPQEPEQAPVEPENKPQEAPKEDDKHLEELINSLKDEIKALKEMNTGLEDKIKDLGKTPSAAPINTNSKSGGGGSTYTAWREQMRQYIGG